MSPLAGSAPIHGRWSEHHRPVAAGAQTARCVITRTSGEGSLDEDGVWHPPTSADVYTGPCRITAPAPSGVLVVGEQQVSIATYEVTIRWDSAETQIGDLVTVTAAPDPGIVGKQLLVNDVRYAAERFERVLKCKIHLSEPEA